MELHRKLPEDDSLDSEGSNEGGHGETRSGEDSSGAGFFSAEESDGEKFGNLMAGETTSTTRAHHCKACDQIFEDIKQYMLASLPYYGANL